MWIVRLALRRPYTFVVMSMLIVLLGGVAITRMPTDIFPEIDIPVVSVVWSYNGISPEEMSDSTYTISNLGMFGVEHFTAIINPPNAAILAVGAAVEKPVVKDGKIVPGHRMSMTQSSDHRIVDGAMAAQYLATVKTTLERPATLLV